MPDDDDVPELEPTLDPSALPSDALALIEGFVPPKPRRGGNPKLIKGQRPYNIPIEALHKNMGGENTTPTWSKAMKHHEMVKVFLEAYDFKRVRKILEAMYDQACDPKSPKQVAAAQFLIERAYHKPRQADDDLEALKKGGITVVLNRPELDPEILGAAAGPKAQPDYIDAEFTEVDR